MPYDKEELFKLPVEEKLELVEALWESIDEEFLGKEITRQGFEEEIDRRIENIEKNPDTLVSWEKVLNQLRDQ
jgi:putative addiction module component (TIGR02574 family)